MIIHLYKLLTGETVIAEFVDQQVVNETTNERIHLVTNPRILTSDDWLDLDTPWIEGMKRDDIQIPIPMRAILLVVEEDEIDVVLAEDYRSRFGE